MGRDRSVLFQAFHRSLSLKIKVCRHCLLKAEKKSLSGRTGDEDASSRKALSKKEKARPRQKAIRVRRIFRYLWVLKSTECQGGLGLGEHVYNQTGKLSKQSHLLPWYCMKASNRALSSQVTAPIRPSRAPLQQGKMEGEPD